MLVGKKKLHKILKNVFDKAEAYNCMGSFLRSANNLEVLLDSSELKVDELEITLEQLSEKYKQLKECDDKVLELLLEEACSHKI